MPLYRVLRRRISAAIDATSTIEQFIDQEFAHPSDQEPSVYRLETIDRAVQAHVEHLASRGGSPPKAAQCGIDVAPLGWHVDHDDPKSPFSFLNAAHHIAKAKDVDEVKRLAAGVYDLIKAGAGTLTIQRASLRDYVRGRYAAADGEWHDFVNGASDSWREFAGAPPPGGETSG
jgi:hypothetical protein